MSHLIPSSILPYVLPVLFGVVIVGVFPLIAGYIVLAERKIMADMQARLGPMRVGPHGLLQPIADAVKLLIKEDIIPAEADQLVFWLAPVLSVSAALLAIAGIAIGPALVLDTESFRIPRRFVESGGLAEEVQRRVEDRILH